MPEAGEVVSRSKSIIVVQDAYSSDASSTVLLTSAILPSSSTPDRDYDSLAKKLRSLQNAHGAVPSAFD
jgi:hypothetical protein